VTELSYKGKETLKNFLLRPDRVGISEDSLRGNGIVDSKVMLQKNKFSLGDKNTNGSFLGGKNELALPEDSPSGRKVGRIGKKPRHSQNGLFLVEELLCH